MLISDINTDIEFLSWKLISTEDISRVFRKRMWLLYIQLLCSYCVTWNSPLSPFRGSVDCVLQWPGYLCWLEFLYSW